MNEHQLHDLLREALAEPAPPQALEARARRLMPSPIVAGLQSLFERARNLVAEIRVDSRIQPALAGFRGTVQPVQILVQAGHHELFLQVTPASETPGSLRVRGQIESTAASTLACDVAASDERGPLYATRSREDGTFDLQLPKGRYDLAIGLDPPFLVPSLELV
jgi:hypothetical protein